MADLARLHAAAWEEIVLPERVDSYPTMLTHEERRLLHWLARDVWEGWGAIVDAGCFLGGSTVSFASGLQARTSPPAPGGPQPPMWSYDRFEAEQYMVDQGYFERWPSIRGGDSFRVAFDDLMGDLVHQTRLRAGDITAEHWDGGPIEILFLDVLKTQELNDVVLSRFLPSLVPGRSVLVQQDYVHGMLPWIHVTMELLGDAVERVGDVAGSRVYAVTGEITAAHLERALPLAERVPVARQRELMEQAVGPTWGPARGSLLLAQVNLLRAHGELGTANALLAHVERQYADVPSVMFDVPATRTELERASQRAAAA